MYRPQFPYPAPKAPCNDQPCVYSFDFTNLPVFLGTLASGARTGRVPLRLDKDADFYLRAIRSQGLISFRLEDTDGNPLSDSENAIQSSNYEFPQLYSDPAGAGVVALDSGADGVFGPAGGNYVVYLFNATASPIDLTTCCLNLFGIKRYAGEGCAT
jgi:hypothetical protein